MKIIVKNLNKNFLNIMTDTNQVFDDFDLKIDKLKRQFNSILLTDIKNFIMNSDISPFDRKNLYDKLDLTVNTYIETLIDTELLNFIQNEDLYMLYNNKTRITSNILNIILHKNHIKTLTYLLQIYCFIIDKHGSTILLKKLIEICDMSKFLTMFEQIDINSIRMFETLVTRKQVDFLIAANYKFRYIFKFQTVEIFQYLMNQSDYDITQTNPSNIYMINKDNIEVFKYIHQNYGQLLNFNMLEQNNHTTLACGEIDILLYIIKNGYNFNNIPIDRIYYHIYNEFLSVDDCEQFFDLVLSYPVTHQFIFNNLKCYWYLSTSTFNKLVKHLDYLTMDEFNQIFNDCISAYVYEFKILIEYVRDFDINKVSKLILDIYKDLL